MSKLNTITFKALNYSSKEECYLNLSDDLNDIGSFGRAFKDTEFTIADIVTINNHNLNNTVGHFEYKDMTMIELKNGHVSIVKEAESTVAVKIQEAMSRAYDEPVSEKNNVSSEDIQEFLKMGDSIVKSNKQIAEHMHTMSEMMTKIVLYITEGGRIITWQDK